MIAARPTLATGLANVQQQPLAIEPPAGGGRETAGQPADAAAGHMGRPALRQRRTGRFMLASSRCALSPVAFGEINTRSHMPHHLVQIRTKGISDVHVVQNRIVQGGHTGWHTHPGPSFVSVASGQATVYHGDDPKRTPHVYPAGTGFVEDAGRVHLIRNEGGTDLELVAFQLLPRGAPRRIDQPKPPHYPF